MKVIIRSKGPKPWSGLDQYRNCHTDIATYWLKDGNKYTGLTKKDADRLGEELGFDLTPNSDYWKSFFIRFTGEDIELDISKPIQELKYLFLKGHRMVQPSINEPRASAEYIIVNAEEDAKVENIKARNKRKSLKEFDKLSSVDIKKALRLYGFKAESISAEQAENKLFELVEENPERFLEIWVNNKSRDTQFLIESALSKNVMRRNKNAYHYGTESIGYSLEDAIDFLDNPKNNDIKMAIANGVEIQ